MEIQRLRNYIKSHRKRAGLSQPDVAFLLGNSDETQVSRYENDRRLPPLEVALALQEIFKVPTVSGLAGEQVITNTELERHRVLAIDIRPQRIAYCVFEGTTLALDWGTKVFRTGAYAAKVPLSVKVARLMSEWQPHAVVMKATKVRRSAQKMRVIERQASMAGVAVHFITIEAIRHAFPTERNKYERARVIAASLPELAHALPTKPKLWQCEPYRIGFFDAAAIGLAYFRQLEKSQ